MEKIVLKGELREARGTARANRLRREGWVPGVLYGHGMENVSFQVREDELHRLVDAGHHLLTLHLGEVQDQGIMKELQFDTYGDRITHVDFARVSLDEIIETKVEVRTVGAAKGVASGGTLDILHHELVIRGKARDLPEHIDLVVDDLGVGDAIRGREMVLPAGIELLLDPEEAVVMVHGRAIAVEDAEAEAEALAAAEDGAEGAGGGGETPEEPPSGGD